jgi:hypothetical protein
MILSSFSITKAQYYKSALGLRLNHYSGGLTYKYFIAPSRAWDLTLSTGFNDGATVTALYERHVGVIDVPGLSWYYGPGFHVGLDGSEDNAYINLGFDGVIGLEYSVPEIPFAFSIDYMPSINLSIRDDSRVDAYFDKWSIGVKYRFSKVVLNSNYEQK